MLKNLITDFNAESIIEIGKNKYECEIYHTSQHNTKIKMNSPVDFEGLIISSENKKQRINFENLNCEFEKNIFTENSSPNLIFKILDSLNDISDFSQNTLENDNIVVLGKIDNIKFEVICDQNGIIKEIFIPEKNIKIQTFCVPLDLNSTS
ncbi:MAG: hypothetical protein LBJ32_00515 [Oscillospiraceae bacterium]|nr:hypothetical protein [Oscillospiraceae bacterium]